MSVSNLLILAVRMHDFNARTLLYRVVLERALPPSYRVKPVLTECNSGVITVTVDLSIHVSIMTFVSTCVAVTSLACRR